MKQKITIKGRDKDYHFYIKPHNRTYVFLELKDYRGETQEIKVHSAIVGILMAIMERVLHNWDGLIIVTGDVGDGKSSIAQLLTTIWEFMFDREQSLDQIVWTSKNFTDQIEKEDNATRCILWDESIQGGTGRDTLTKQGQVLKKAFVTKRYKRHLYLLLVDEILEFNKKIISRSRAWIHVHTEGMRRGYFKIYYDKKQIKRMYRRLKVYNEELDEVMDKEFPQYRGYQPNTSDLFFDPEEYQKRKSEETDAEDNKVSEKDRGFIEQRDKLMLELHKLGMQQKDIASIVGIDRTQVSRILVKLREVVSE